MKADVDRLEKKLRASDTAFGGDASPMSRPSPQTCSSDASPVLLELRREAWFTLRRLSAMRVVTRVGDEYGYACGQLGGWRDVSTHRPHHTTT